MNKSLYLWLGFSFSLLYACENTDPPKSEKLIQEAIAQKIALFKANKNKECLENVFYDANKLVDSIIAQQLNLDTVPFPNRPIKPMSPELKKIPEELKLEPIKK